MHHDIINQYYGTHGARIHREPGQSGAGHSLDEVYSDIEDGEDLNEDQWEELEDEIVAANEANFHHEPVAVPKHTNPFPTDEFAAAFDAALAAVRVEGTLPSGYGLLAEEWEDMYPSYEIIRSGHRGGKVLRVSLPEFQWMPRAEVWGQALDILNRLTYMFENDAENNS